MKLKESVIFCFKFEGEVMCCRVVVVVLICVLVNSEVIVWGKVIDINGRFGFVLIELSE